MARFFFIVFLLACTNIFAQHNFKLIAEYNASTNHFSTDQLGNIYFLKNSELQKIDVASQKQFTYSTNIFGAITIIDVTDPLRLLIYNEKFNRLIFLDNRLAEISDVVSLNSHNYYNVAAICQSNSNGFWIFDRNLNELVYFDQNMKQQKKSAQITSLLDPEKELREIFMLEKNDYIYLGIKGLGVLLFDVYGSYIKTFPITEITRFQVLENQIVYFSNNSLLSYNTQNFNKEVLSLPVDNAINARLEQNNLYILTSKKLLVYQFSTKK